ncbi:MAG: Rpn family recombination-promoting nuclease/putative transposase, partial [Myxococcaceae bacterium]
MTSCRGSRRCSPTRSRTEFAAVSCTRRRPREQPSRSSSGLVSASFLLWRSPRGGSVKQKRVSKFRSHHDSLFRAAFARPEALRSEAEVLLPPPFVRSLDFSRVNLLQTRFIDESLAHSESDATFRIAQHQREAFVYVLLEHQRKSDALMPWRLLRYMTSVWMSVLGSEPNRRKLPMLVPMVLSNVPGGWKGPRSFSEVVELEDELRVLSSVVPEFEFVLDDLANATTDSLRHRPGPEFTRLALWLLASSSTPDRIIDEAPVWTDTVERL